MPVYYNDGLDDGVVYDRQASFVGGQISNFRENLLNESQAELLKDLDAPKNGVLKSRRGFHRFADLLGSTSSSTNVQGIAYFDTDAKEALIVFVNGKIYSINSSGTVSDIASAAVKVNSLDARVYTAQSADKLFYTSHNGNNRIGQIEWDTSSSAFVVTEFPAAPTNSKFIVSNNFRAFAYQPSDDQIYVSDILAHAAHGTPPFPTGNAFKVGLGDPVTGLASWVGFNVVVFCKNSCYVVDTAPVPATSGATTPAASTFKIRTISASTGCVSHGSIAQVGEDLFFLSRTGVRSIRRTMEENMVASDVGVISYPIQDVIDEINWAAVENATAVFWNNRYLLSVPTGTSTVNNTTLCYNTNTQSWTGVWQGTVEEASGTPASTINPYQFVVTQFSGGKPYLISLDKVGNPLQFRDFIEDINLVDTDFQDKTTTTFVDTGWQAVTRALTFNEQVTTKDGEFAEFEFDRSNAVIDIGVILDGAEQTDNLADELDTGTGELRLSFTLPSTLGSGKLNRFRYSMTQYPEFRELQFKFQQSGTAGADSKYLALRSIHAGGFLNSVGVES
tara:strand:+ start:436 stop:2121 length:1686 start_codon:yes stop_codon:yes gene_type:complete